MNLKQLEKKIKSKFFFINYFFPSSTQKLISYETTSKLDSLFFSSLKKLKIKSLIECGAFEANASMEATKLDLNALAIEANPKTFEKITPPSSGKFVKKNYALSDKESFLKFYFPKFDNSHGGTIHPKTNRDYNCIDVPSIRLDKLIEMSDIIKQPYGLWIDIEGAQKEFLNGAKNTLKSKNCLIFKIEVEDQKIFNGQSWLSNEVNEFLINLGYRPIFRDFEYYSQYNVLYVKNSLVSFFEDEIDLIIAKLNKKINIKKLFFFIIKEKKSILFDLEIHLIKIFGQKFFNKIKNFFLKKV